MPTFVKQTNFTAGEISPRMKGRTDYKKYGNASETMLNVYAQPHGGATRRSGTRYINETKDSTKASRLVRFEFSVTQAYILEFGDQYIRVFKDQGRVQANGTITDITEANPGNVEQVAHGLVTDDTVTFENVGGMVELNDNNYTITKVDADNYTIGVDTTGYTTWTSGGEAIIEGDTPYLEADLFELYFTQSADTLYIFHGDYHPRVLSRTSHTSWSFEKVDFVDGPYLEENDTATTIAPSATTGSITLTSSVALWAATDVDRIVTIKHSTTWGVAKITGFTSTTVVDATVIDDFGAATAVATWRLGAWSDTTGWPKKCTFFENRLVAANTDTEPQGVWLSKIKDYTDFGVETTIVDDDAVDTVLVANNVNVIQWVAPAKSLIVGTNGGEWTLIGDASTGITPTSLRQIRETTHGSYDLHPISIDEVLLYIQRHGKRIREFVYSFETDAFVSPDLIILAEHLTRSNSIVDWTYAENPSSIVWLVRDDGALLGMTYMRNQQVVAWHRHTTDGSFESVSYIPGTDSDEVWAIVNRTIDGNTVRYVEMFEAEFNPGTDTDATEGKFLDSMLSYSGSAVASVSGLDHLEGESVSILADGKVHPAQTVASGAVSLNYDASDIHVGLPYTSDIKTLPIEVDAQTGTSTGRTKRITRVSLKLHESIGCQVGRDSDNLDYVPFNEAQVYGTAIPLFSGDKEIDFEMDDDYDGVVFIRQDQPLPLTVLSISTEVEFNAR